MTGYDILIVEDEYLIATDIAGMLEIRGVKSSRIANSGRGAIAEVTRQRPDIILMDIVLSGDMDGIDTAREIKKSHDIPVVFLTAHSDDSTVLKAKTTEPHGYLLKPINEMDLYTTIEIAIHKHGTDRQLKESQEKFRELAHHLQTLREDERTRISREIHDELGQTLTALRMDLFWLQENISNAGKQASVKIDSMMDLVDHTIEKVRSISSHLRPGILDDLGLCSAIEWLVGDIQGRSEVQYEVCIQPESFDVDGAIATDVFRIVQESITNITRHARASRASIALTDSNQFVTLSISDDGIGIPPERLSDPRSFGLIGIRERAFFHSGEAVISSVPGRGTTITVKIPKTTMEVHP